MRPVVALLLSILLTLPPLGSSARAQAAPAKLNIVIVEGEGAINNIRQRTAREVIVQVEDENHKPVAGAAVLFLLPDSGAGGVFDNGTRTLQVRTDSGGRAVAKGLRANDVPGKFQIRVEASFEGVTASAAVTQVNAAITAAAAGGISGKLLAILAIAGGAAAGGIVVATRKDKGSPASPPPPPTTISAGTPTVGGPQ
ncbi:MAG: hypothetical protein IT159_09985 [Bryobacterales bacterium]|jgi:hypothetical protein|nr:hypothetical protein [Bryobacterales bacterium]